MDEKAILRAMDAGDLGQLLNDAVNECFIDHEELGHIVRTGSLEHLTEETLGQLIAYGTSEDLIPTKVLGELVLTALAE